MKDADRNAGARLRILQVVPTYYPAVRYGGPIRSVHGLSSALARRGHSVHVYTTSMDGPHDLDVPFGVPVMMDGVAVHYFPVPALRRFAWSPSLGRALRDTVGEFDLLHLHSVFLWPLQAAARAARRAGVPYLLAPRGMLVGNVIRARSRWAKAAWIELFGKRTLREAAGLHATADIEIDGVRALGLKFGQAYCVQNGVDWPARPAPLADGPFAGIPQPYALFLSRLSWKKGLDRLIRAWRDVRDLPLVICGNDYEGLLPGLRALAREQGVAERVFFVGEANDRDKWALYAGARLLVLPSYSENFGNVVAEAMAMSCPVVITRAVGIAPLVERGGAGIICGDEPADIAAAVNKLAEDAHLRLQMGVRGRAVVEASLSWDAVASKMEAAYRDVVARARTRPVPLQAA